MKMRFFTPELYIRFNSPDDEVADRANEEWEHAISRYQKHLNGIREQLPSPVRSLSELCLHDGEVLNFEKEVLVPSAFGALTSGGQAWAVLALLGLRLEETVWTLLYFLGDRVREYPPDPDWPFSKEQRHWLYDEIDLAPNRPHLFVHRVLFTDCSVVEIPFVSVVTTNMPLHKAGIRESVG